MKKENASELPKPTKWRKAWLLGPMVVFFLGSVFFRMYINGELPAMGPQECDSTGDALQTHSSLEQKFYGKLMWLKFGTTKAWHVAMVKVEVPALPYRVTTNACESRKLMTDLVPQVARQHPRVIVIDQSFSKDGCEDENVNEPFRETLNAPGMPPIVVGSLAQVGTETDRSTGDCMVEQEPFDFRPHITPVGASSRLNVSSGLTLLNADERKIPIEWYALTPQEVEAHVQNAKQAAFGIAFAAASVADEALPENPNIVKYRADYEHPFSNFAKTILTVSALDVLCSADGASTVRDHKWGNCSRPVPADFGLEHKVVVIGQFNNTDKDHFNADINYRSQLQANYIESLLDGNYAHQAPWWLDIPIVGLCLAFWLYAGFEESSLPFGKVKKVFHRLFKFDKQVGMTVLLLVLLSLVNLGMIELGYFAPISMIAWMTAVVGVGTAVLDMFFKRAQDKRNKEVK